MRCFARTKGRSRCRKNAAFVFCSSHRMYPLTILFSALVFVGLISGIFRDLVEPLLAKGFGEGPSTDEMVQLDEIRVPIELESTWDTDTRLDSAARIFLTKPGAHGDEDVVYSAVARVEVPEGGATLNDEIWIPSYKTTNTFVTLPRAQQVADLLKSGGCSLRIELKNRYGHDFTFSKTVLFDEKVISKPVHFWLRLDFEQVPR